MTVKSKLQVYGIAILLLALGACGGNSQPETAPAAMPATAKTDTGPTEAPTAPGQGTDSEAAPTEPPPDQVSELDDGSESVEETPSTPTGTLHLASVAKPEPKPAASSFKEGVHYLRLVPTQPTGVNPGQVEIIEFFWYGCPHCFALDPALENWRANGKPNFVQFSRVPVTWGDIHRFHARLFYTAEDLGQLAKLHPLIFREIHVNGNPLNTMDKAKEFFTSQGVRQAEFDKAFAARKLEDQLREADLLGRRFQVRSVPFFVVNGKFTTDEGMAGGREQLLQLLNELAASEERQ